MSQRTSQRQSSPSAYEASVHGNGHRLTPQRREIYDLLLAHRNHPTATELFIEAKKQRPTISLATVYNCLDTLVECGLVKQVNMEREATRYCPNLEEHGHFHCTTCGKVFDVALVPGQHAEKLWKLPKGFRVESVEVTLRGICADCNTKRSRKN